MKKLFEVHQKITLLANEYKILKDASEGQQVIGYAKQKRLALREQFTLYKDESQEEIQATSKARSVLDLGPTFDVYDKDGKPLAVFKKEFKKSLLVSSWSIYDSEMRKVLFQVQEKSVPIAIFRRLWEFVPFVSEIMPFPLKFHFSIKTAGQIAGEYRKITLIRDHYSLYLKDRHINVIDEPAWMVFAVLLDAMQSR